MLKLSLTFEVILWLDDNVVLLHLVLLAMLSYIIWYYYISGCYHLVEY
jgi:hypothetical protein